DLTLHQMLNINVCHHFPLPLTLAGSPTVANGGLQGEENPILEVRDGRKSKNGHIYPDPTCITALEKTGPFIRHGSL
ncbi:UNVERIFIED_CONTAM: hypothetical protein K2H54_075432, partial [Gekko kuhli]